MKHFYSVALATALSLLFSTTGFSQNKTYVAPSNRCEVLEDFDATSGEFRSPSIFTESDYTEFNWDAAQGYWTERSGLTMPHAGSLISPVYINQQASGGIDLGFRYEICPGAEYRIRLINVQCTCVGGYDIVATTANGPEWTAFPSTSGRLCLRLNDADLFQGQKFRVEISYRNTAGGCNWVFDDFSLGGEQGAIILPVTFLGINAKKEATNAVSVKWDVAQEVDVRGYEVEKSQNGVTFTKVGYVAANGKPAYAFTDAQGEEGVVYYRVKNVDIDGKYKYSSVVKLNGRTNSASTVLKAFPSPAQSSVTVQHDKLGATGSITLTTLSGQVVKRLTPGAQAVQTTIDLTGTTPGMYLIQTSDNNGNNQSVKIVKQ